MAGREVVDLLVARGETLATAESLTGGGVAAAVSAVPGASAVFVGGVVTYSADLKVDLLGVPQPVIAGPGAVSDECARAMALGARTLTGADWAIATTGVAGPTEQEGKPVGTVFVAVAGPTDAADVRRLALAGDRAAIREASCRAALDLLIEQLRD